MVTDSRKIRIIEAVLKVEDDTLLNEVEAILSQTKNEKPPTKSFIDFTNSFTEEEAREFEKVIEEGCEKIDENEWK